MIHYGRIRREPAQKPPNWADHLIDVLIEHQVAVAMLLWLVILCGVLIWWMR